MKTILLLHGATGSREDLLPLLDALSIDFVVYSINLYGHFGEVVAEDFSIEIFARQVLDWIDEHSFDKIIVAGYSLGGYVGLYLSLFYPEKIEKAIT